VYWQCLAVEMTGQAGAELARAQAVELEGAAPRPVVEELAELRPLAEGERARGDSAVAVELVARSAVVAAEQDPPWRNVLKTQTASWSTTVVSARVSPARLPRSHVTLPV